jgi:hypothetical protein
MRLVSYANVVSTCALVVALGGGAYAVASVTGRNIVNGSVTGKDIKKHSVTLDRLKGAAPAGPQGPRGQDGASATSLWAVVNSVGVSLRGSGLTSSSKVSGNGQYNVIFNRDVSACSYQVTLSGVQGESIAQPLTDQAQGVYVATYNSAGSATDRAFHLAVFC